MIYAKPKKAAFQHMLFRSKRFGLMETKWLVTVIYEAVLPDKMSEQSQSMYRALKGMECIMESGGFPRRRFWFQPNRFLRELKAQIPEMNISDDLAKTLNENLEVVRMVRRVRPDDLEISLHSIPAEYQPFVSNREVLLRAMAEYFKKPVAISWSVTVGKAIGQGLSSKKTADEIMQLLSQITMLLGKKMEELSLNQTAPASEADKPPEA